MKLKTINSFNDLYLLNEQVNTRVAGVFSGAVKPPHRGPYHTAHQAAQQCDTLFILMSDKPRELSQSNSSSTPDWERYKALLPGGRQAEQLQHVNVELASCARPDIGDKPASASRLRSQIASYAFDHQDFDTFMNNINDFIPGSLTDKQRREVAERMVSHAQDNVVDAYESAGIWEIYIEQLKRETGTDIVFEILQGSPVAMTYSVVSTIDENNTFDLVKLFVGC